MASRKAAPPAIPYFTHPLEVAAILTDLKLDDATIRRRRCLHEHHRGHADDACRDRPGPSGPISAHLVEGLTKLKKETRPGCRARPSRPRNLRKLLLAIADDVRVAAGEARRPPGTTCAPLEYMPAEGPRRGSAQETLDIYAPPRRTHGYAPPAARSWRICRSGSFTRRPISLSANDSTRWRPATAI